MEIRQLYIVIIIYCVRDYERSHTTAFDTNRSCACTYSCDFSHVCSPTPNCNRENVALGKPANISSRYQDSGPACVAVNGNIGTIYTSTTNGQTPNCIQTRDGDTNAWWQVNLGRAYTVTNISVFIRDGFPDRMDGVSITVDGQDCYTFPSGTTGSPVQKQVWCNTPRTGSLVKFSRNDLLNICEVQVWVCKDGFFGKDCNKACSSKCRNDLICDNVYGTCHPDGACSCSSGCNFTQSCIPTDNCQKENVALGKPARISSSYSDDEGPAGPACVAVNGNTGTTYVTDTQGGHPNCIHTAVNDSNPWWEVDLGRIYIITDITVYVREDHPDRIDNVQITVDGKDCYTFPTGTTSSPPMKDISCSTPLQGRIVRLSRNAGLLNFCEVQVWGCSTGYYGFHCTQECGRCKDNSACNSTNGNCMSGCQTGWEEPMCKKCSRGYYGINCSQICGNCKVGSTCNSTNGQCLTGCETGWKVPMCTECSEGYYGYNCSQRCGNCKSVISCNASTGQCLTGCQEGWLEPLCAECIHGFYGEDCNIPCGHCKDGQMCNNTDSVCPDGCEDGYEFPLCNQKCSSETWGRNCQNACGACLGRTCRHDNGICEKGCFSGYEGEHCTVLLQQTNDHDQTGVIAGSVVGAGLLIGGSIVAAVLIWLRRSTLKDNRCPQPSLEDRETHGTSIDNLVVQNLNFHENAYDKLEPLEDVAKPYEKFGKEIHVDNVMQSLYQNTSDDSKPYENI